MKLPLTLHGLPVGELTRSGDRCTFALSESYLALPSRPVLGRSFEDHLTPRHTWEGRRSKLPSFFSHYLPEEHHALRDELAGKLRAKPSDEFRLLAALGSDLPGALAVQLPTPAHFADSEALTSPALAAREQETLTLRFSIAGVQMKFSVLRDDAAAVFRARGPGGDWLAKLASVRHPGLPENEYTVMSLARAAGITTPEFQLVSTSQLEGIPAPLLAASPSAFAIQRYDRTPEGPVHQEDFAQVFGVPAEGEAKYEGFAYEHIARVTYRLCGEQDLLEFVRRLAFCVLVGNQDMHLKNWSLIYPDRIRARLSPAYDLVATTGYIDDDTMALKFYGHKESHRVSLAQFARLETELGLAKGQLVSVVTETVRRTREAWEQQGPSLPMLAPQKSALAQHLESATRALTASPSANP